MMAFFKTQYQLAALFHNRSFAEAVCDFPADENSLHR
jgi:hypothetical protein